MSILNVEHLSHGFGDRAIFEDVSFRLLKGEHIGLIGANGEGKSTFMNTITGKLTAEQIEFLQNHRSNRYTIIGGSNAVSDEMKLAIEGYIDTEIGRIYGETREATAIAVAEAFFPDAEAVYIAFSRDFPDGLCGGPLAYAQGAPLLLINNKTEQYAQSYIQKHNIKTAYVLGGTNVISEKSIAIAFS